MSLNKKQKKALVMIILIALSIFSIFQISKPLFIGGRQWGCYDSIEFSIQNNIVNLGYSFNSRPIGGGGYDIPFGCSVTFSEAVEELKIKIGEDNFQRLLEKLPIFEEVECQRYVFGSSGWRFEDVKTCQVGLSSEFTQGFSPPDGNGYTLSGQFEIDLRTLITIFRFLNNECNELEITEETRLPNDYDTLSECEERIYIPPNEIIVYRFEENSCKVLTIIEENKLPNDFDTLEECEEKIEIPPIKITSLLIILGLILFIIGLVFILIRLRKK